MVFLSLSGNLEIGMVGDNHYPHPTTDFLVWLLKSSSNWSKLSMMGPQLFSGWYQMILDFFRCSQLFSYVLSRFPMFSAVFRCSQLFYDVFSWVITFLNNHPSVRCITHPCARILWSSLFVVGNLWQDQDAYVGNRTGPDLTTGLLEEIGKPSVAASLSHLEASWRFKASVHLFSFWRRGTIGE